MIKSKDIENLEGILNNVINLSDYNKKRTLVHFSKDELQKLLNIYTLHVIKGEWRDYSVTFTSKFAQFCIFQHSSDDPLFTITKTKSQKKARSKRNAKDFFIVEQKKKLICKTNILSSAIQSFSKRPRIINN